jgi:toxin ParE1/3/4
MSSRNLEFSTRARRDVSSLLQYSLEQWGEEGHRDYSRVLGRAFSTLQSYPEIGRLREEFGPGVRFRLVKKHMILYRTDGQTITIARVLHQRFDVDRIMENAKPLDGTNDVFD